MHSPPRVLIAVQPAVWAVVRRMLEGMAELVPVHSIGDAFLELESARFDLIVCTVAFDDSQMIDFLQAVKRKPELIGIPFLCSRVLPSVLSDELIRHVAAVCHQFGAVDFVDIAKLSEPEAQGALRAAVNASLTKH
jgi:hypothetical protein